MAKRSQTGGARATLRETDLVHEAEVEHASAKDLVAQIEGAPAHDKLVARVKVLGEYVSHHVKAEESTLFGQLKRTRLDLAALGERLLERKRQLSQGTGNGAADADRGIVPDAPDAVDEPDEGVPAARTDGMRGGRRQPAVPLARGGRRSSVA
jgi:hypothetical protein